MESSRPERRRVFARFFGYMFFEKIIMTLFKCICTVFGNIFFEKIVMTLFKSICTVFGDVFFEDDCYGIG